MTKRKIKKAVRRLCNKQCLIKTGIVLGILVFFWNMYSINSKIYTLTSGQQNLIDEVGSYNDFNFKQKEYLTSFAEDLNEIRGYLLLPTREYSFSKAAEKEDPKKEESALATSLLIYFDHLSNEKEHVKLLEEKTLILNQTIEKEEIKEILTSNNVLSSVETSEEAVNLVLKDGQQTLLASIELPLKEKNLNIMKPFQTSSYPYETEDDIESLIQDFLETNLEQIQEYIVKR